MQPTVDGERLRERFEAFSEIGATERGGVDRPSLSPANREARDRLVEWFEAAGLDVTVDEMGNLFGRRAGADGSLPPVLLGSHVDSQYNGGRYDGIVGVLGALEVVESLDDAGTVTERPVEVVAWSNEEGVRFQPDMLGSGVFAGAFKREEDADRSEDPGSERQGEHVVAGRPDEVLLHLPVARLREPDESNRVERVVVDEDDVARFDGDVGSRQCGRIVDAVADHRDQLPLRLEPFDRRVLLLGQHLREALIDAGEFGDGHLLGLSALGDALGGVGHEFR